MSSPVIENRTVAVRASAVSAASSGSQYLRYAAIGPTEESISKSWNVLCGIAGCRDHFTAPDGPTILGRNPLPGVTEWGNGNRFFPADSLVCYFGFPEWGGVNIERVTLRSRGGMPRFFDPPGCEEQTCRYAPPFGKWETPP